MDRLYYFAIMAALAGVVWWQTERIDDMRDQINAANARGETIQKSQEITGDVHSLDDDDLGNELNSRLSEPAPE